MYKAAQVYLCLIATLFLLVIIYFVLSTDAKLERITVTAEKMDGRLEEMSEAVKPLGKAAILKGIDAVNQVDTEELGESATEGAKVIGTAALEKMIRIIENYEPGGSASSATTSSPDNTQ